MEVLSLSCSTNDLEKNVPFFGKFCISQEEFIVANWCRIWPRKWNIIVVGPVTRIILIVYVDIRAIFNIDTKQACVEIFCFFIHFFFFFGCFCLLHSITRSLVLTGICCIIPYVSPYTADIFRVKLSFIHL